MVTDYDLSHRARVDAFLTASMDSWLHLFQELLHERSVFEREHGIVELVTKRLSACGVAVVPVDHSRAVLERIPAACRPFSNVPGRTSVVARVPGTGTGRSLAFNTHLDIVPEGNPAHWTHPPFSGDVDHARRIIHGRGAMDDRAGVVIALAVMETIARLPVRLAGDVLFQFVLEDETTGNGTLLCLQDGHGTDAAIIIDGTRRDRAITKHAGQLQFEVVAHGSSSSVSVSHVGVNAAEILFELLLVLRQKVFDLNAGRTGEWLLFPSPFQFVTQGFAADCYSLTVPDLARATCYVTFPPPSSLAQMRLRIEDWARSFAARRRIEGRFEILWGGFAAEPVEADSGELCRVLQSIAGELGMEPPVPGPSTGTSDLRHFAAAGIPSLLYGPGAGYNPHRVDEYYELDELPKMVRLFVECAVRWCGRAKAAGVDGEGPGVFFA